MPSFIPLGKRVLIERAEEEIKSTGGIIIPDSAKEKPRVGKIVAVSKKLETKQYIKCGDTVIFGRFAGTEVNIGGTMYIVMDITDILGITKEI